MLNLPNRIYAQYRGKPKAEAYLNIANAILNPSMQALETIRYMYDVDNAYGEMLRIIGRIVVLDRAMKEELMGAGVFAKPDGTEFEDKDSIFAKWSTYVGVDVDDSFLRLMIKAKIVKNSSIATIDAMLDAINFLFPNIKAVRLVNYKDMSFTVIHLGQIEPLEQFLIDNVASFIPTPQGVECRGFKYIGSFIPFVPNVDNGQFNNKSKEFYGKELINGN